MARWAALAPSRSSERLTRDEMIAINAKHLREAVRRLRPGWLRQRTSVRTAASELRVFMNSQDMGGVSFLETVRPEAVVELRFVNAIDAQVSYGTQYGRGVIVIVTRGS